MEELKDLSEQDIKVNVEQLLKAYSEQDKKDKIERYRRLNQYVKKGQIVFAGSSLMEQFPIYEFIQDFDIDKVIYNRGIGGFTTIEMLEVLDVCIFDLKPSRIFLNIGTNDMNDAAYKEEELIGRYDIIVSKIMEILPKVELFLMAYYPINESKADNVWQKEIFKTRSNARILSANGAVEQLARKYDVRYIDVNKNLYDEEGRMKPEFTIEGMHMYGNGYKEVLDEMMKYIME